MYGLYAAKQLVSRGMVGDERSYGCLSGAQKRTRWSKEAGAGGLGTETDKAAFLTCIGILGDRCKIGSLGP